MRKLKPLDQQIVDDMIDSQILEPIGIKQTKISRNQKHCEQLAENEL
jgi:hypothetical protein